MSRPVPPPNREGKDESSSILDDTTDEARVALDDTSPAPDGDRRSLGKLLLWSSLDLDPSGFGARSLGLAAGIAAVASFGVFYLLGQSFQHMGFWQYMPILVGLLVGGLGVRDVIVARPAQLIVPLAQVFAVVVVLTLTVRSLSSPASVFAASRAVLAWSLGLHLCLLPLSTRLWAIFFAERASTEDYVRTRDLLARAETQGTNKSGEILVVRILEVDGGLTAAEVIGGAGSGVLRLKTRLLSPQPCPGRVYVLDRALTISRTLAGSRAGGEWERNLISFGESVLVGDRPTIAPASDAAALSRQSMWLLVTISAGLSLLAVVAALS